MKKDPSVNDQSEIRSKKKGAKVSKAKVRLAKERGTNYDWPKLMGQSVLGPNVFGPKKNCQGLLKSADLLHKWGFVDS